MTIALESAPRQAKFAARYVAYSKHRALCAELIEVSLSRQVTLVGCHGGAGCVKLDANSAQTTLEKADSKHVPKLLTHMRVFSELALSAPVEFEAKSAEIVAFILHKIMYRKSPSHDVSGDTPWCEDITDNAVGRSLRRVGPRGQAGGAGPGQAPRHASHYSPVARLLPR